MGDNRLEAAVLVALARYSCQIVLFKPIRGKRVGVARRQILLGPRDLDKF